jgi:methylamine dehydrogenase accessory protein MauD
MTQALLVSNILLWFVVLGLIALVVALTRQIGVLYERVAPVGALAFQKGPAVGEPAPEMTLATLRGSTLEIGGEDAEARRTLLFFLSSTCPVCKTLLPTLQRMAGQERPAPRLVYASDGEASEYLAFAKQHGLASGDFVLSHDLGLRFEVSKLPYAVLIDATGIVRAKGIVNTREHLESLFEAERLGVASLQQYMERERAPDALQKGAAR